MAGACRAAVTETTYLCRAGEAPQRLEAPPRGPAPATLPALRDWDAFAVSAISRAVRGEVPLREALPLFETLAQAGPFAGSFGSRDAPLDPFVDLRLRRFLDAAARLAAGPPPALVRAILGEPAVAAELRQDGLGEARRGAQALCRQRQAAGGPAAWAPFIPLLTTWRAGLSDGDLATRALQSLNAGAPTAEVATLLGRTLLWDLRLYLLAKPTDKELAAALALSDDALRADLQRAAGAGHLRWLLVGAAAGGPGDPRWAGLEAERFLSERPDFAWVGHAAALLHELTAGTTLTLRGEAAPALLKTGTTLPLTYTVEPAAGASFATPVLVWPGKVEMTYEGVRCLDDTRLALLPGPISGVPTACGLQFSVVFTQAGSRRLGFQYRLYGLELAMVTHLVEVTAEGSAAPAAPAGEGWAPEAVVVELPTPPSGYQPVVNSGLPVSPGQAPVVNGGRRFFEFADGEHGMDQTILYEVRAAAEDHFPEEFTYCDLNPVRDRSLAAKTVAEADRLLPGPLRRLFALAPTKLRVLGRDCWVGRKGKGPDGRTYYVLCRGSETYYRRNEAFTYQRFWDPLLGEQEIYDTTKIRDDTVAFAAAVLTALRTVGPGAAPGPATTGPRAMAFVKDLREILDADANLQSRLNLTVGAWQQKALDDAAAAKTVADDVVGGYDALVARAAGLQPPDATYTAVLDSLRTDLGLGALAARLIERGIRGADPDRVTKGLALLRGYEADRQALRARVGALELELRGAQVK